MNRIQIKPVKAIKVYRLTKANNAAPDEPASGAAYMVVRMCQNSNHGAEHYDTMISMPVSENETLSKPVLAFSVYVPGSLNVIW